MSATGDLSRLEAIIDASGVPERIEMLLGAGVRPRQLSVRTLLLGILTCLADQRPAHLRRIHRALTALSETEKRRLGVIAQWDSGPHELTYRQLEYTFTRVVRTLAKQKPDGAPSQILTEVLDGLIEGSISVLSGREGPQSSSYAIDWSDYESFARAPRKPREKEQAQQDAGQQQDVESREGQDNDGGPADKEAAWGHRKVNHPAKSESFYGYYLQALTSVRQERGPQVPELVRRIQIASCKHDPPAMITPVICRMAEQGTPIGDLLADSGYSYRESATFATPIRATGAKLIIDPHSNDRGQKGTHDGAIICNGNLHCPATPKALFELSPLAPAAGAEQTKEHEKRCAELHRHKLAPISARDQDGYHRVICPAAAGKIRCPIRAESMSLPHDRPSILGAPEHPPACCTQKTITVPGSVNAKTAQKHDYPSKAHRDSYARRTASERTFSQVYDPASNDISRGFCRLMGLTPNALMLAGVFIVSNIRTADAFAARKAEDQRRAACGLPPRRRRRRRAEPTHQHAAKSPAKANAPPA